MVGHFAILPDTTIVAIGRSDRNKDPAFNKAAPKIFMGKEGDNALQPLAANKAVPDGKPGELFSLVIDVGRNLGIVADRTNNMVIFIDLQRRELIKQIPFTEPWGLAYNQKQGELFISGDRQLGKIDSKLDEIKAMQVLAQADIPLYFVGHSLLV